MRFRVENLGPLREAEVDLDKRLIVLTGPNNTGKTYFATAVYGFFRTPTQAPSNLDALAARAIPTGRFTIRREELLSSLLESLRAQALSFQRRLDECFGLAEGELTDARVSIQANAEDVGSLLHRAPLEAWTEEDDWERVIRSISDGDAYEIILLDAAREPVFPTTEEGWASLPRIAADTPREKLSQLGRSAVREFQQEVMQQRVRIFPAERLAIDLFAGEMAAARLQMLDEVLAGRTDNPYMKRFTWPIRDAVQFVLRLPRLALVQSSFTDLVDDLERDVLGGSIGVSQSGVATFTPWNVAKRLDVQQAASVVKSLSSIAFYIRHQAQQGDFLIIDEPELNLHPDNQRKVARFLARAVNRGFRVLISTHSDYLLRELSSLLMLGRPDERAKRLAHDLGYPDNALLKPEDVGVYLFQDGTAKELEVSVEGFEVKTIEDEISRLNQDAQKIYSAFLD